jgi:hypothetical protein
LQRNSAFRRRTERQGRRLIPVVLKRPRRCGGGTANARSAQHRSLHLQRLRQTPAPTT